MKISDLKKGYSVFGNKGNVWSNQCHISKDGLSAGTTLCGVPMLSTNWAKHSEDLGEKITEIGCKECLAIYNKL